MRSRTGSFPRSTWRRVAALAAAGARPREALAARSAMSARCPSRSLIGSPIVTSGSRSATRSPGARSQLLDDARVRRGDRELHLHRLEDEQDVALVDRSPSATCTSSTVPGIGACSASPAWACVGTGPRPRAAPPARGRRARSRRRRRRGRPRSAARSRRARRAARRRPRTRARAAHARPAGVDRPVAHRDLAVARRTRAARARRRSSCAVSREPCGERGGGEQVVGRRRRRASSRRRSSSPVSSVAGADVGVGEQRARERRARRDAEDRAAGQRAVQPAQRRRTVGPVGDDLREQRVVVRR